MQSTIYNSVYFYHGFGNGSDPEPRKRKRETLEEEESVSENEFAGLMGSLSMVPDDFELPEDTTGTRKFDLCAIASACGASTFHVCVLTFPPLCIQMCS